MKIYCHGRPVALQCMDLNMVNREYPDLPKHRLKPNLCKPVFNEDHQSRVYLSCDGPKRLDVQFSLKDFVAYRYPNGL